MAQLVALWQDQHGSKWAEIRWYKTVDEIPEWEGKLKGYMKRRARGRAAGDAGVLEEVEVFGQFEATDVDEIELEDATYDADAIAELAALSEVELAEKRRENQLERERKIAEELQSRGVVARRVGSLRAAAKVRESDSAQRPTKQQYGMMKRMKLKWSGEQLGWDPIETKAQAGRVLSACFQRGKVGLASPAVVARLAGEIREAIEDGRADRQDCVAEWAGVSTMTKNEVAAWITRLRDDS